ncbi:hypothetical protein JCM8547_004123 [Rhodosporidiobolus lusitaniae]
MTTDLAVLLPSLLPEDDVALAVEGLKELGFTTAVDLAFLSTIPPHPSLPPSTFSRLQAAVVAHLGAPSTSGAYLLQKHDDRKGKQPQRFSSSLEELDDHLAGGFELGDVVEICGPPRSGRTAVALYAILLHLLLHPDKRAAWLDTGGTFDPYRCLAILRDVIIPRLVDMGGSFAGDDEVEPEPEKLAITVLDRLAVSRVGKSGDALDTLTAETRVTDTSDTLDMVVIDQLDALLGGAPLSGTSAQGPANLVAFMRRLSSLAQSSALPLVIFVITTASPPAPTSSSTSRPTAPKQLPSQPPPLSSLPLPTPLKPALGSTYTYLLDISLLVLPAEPLFGPKDGRGNYLLEVTKNPRGRTGGLVAFSLENGVKLEQLEQ